MAWMPFVNFETPLDICLPMVKFKVYIIDEVHMLSGSAFNALLEDFGRTTRSCDLFVMATTEVQKIPNTILVPLSAL